MECWTGGSISSTVSPRPTRISSGAAGGRRSFGFDLSAFPDTAAHFERMQGRDSVRKLLAYEQEVLDEFASAA